MVDLVFAADVPKHLRIAAEMTADMALLKRSWAHFIGCSPDSFVLSPRAKVLMCAGTVKDSAMRNGDLIYTTLTDDEEYN